MNRRAGRFSSLFDSIGDPAILRPRRQVPPTFQESVECRIICSSGRGNRVIGRSKGEGNVTTFEQ